MKVIPSHKVNSKQCMSFLSECSFIPSHQNFRKSSKKFLTFTRSRKVEFNFKQVQNTDGTDFNPHD